MREAIDLAQLDAVFISHMHADHFFDLIPLRYALRYEVERSPLPVYLPPGGIDVLKAVARPLKDTGDFFNPLFDLHEYSVDGPVAIGDIRARFAPTVHYIPAYAMRLESPSGVLGFSADTAPCEAVSDLVRNADVFLCEAALGSDGEEDKSDRGHLNAREAGNLAAEAGVRHLVLTHYDARANAVDMRDAAARAFSGPITVADDGVEIALGQYT
jgi:ribonuclease BN (tRNA processing enzyme)